MQWKKHKRDTGTEYSASSGPVAFWIQDNDGDFDIVIHYGGHTETVVLSNLNAAKTHCKDRAVALLQETLATVQSLENSAEWEPIRL